MNDVYGGKNGVLVLEGGGWRTYEWCVWRYGGKNDVLVLEGGGGWRTHHQYK